MFRDISNVLDQNGGRKASMRESATKASFPETDDLPALEEERVDPMLDGRAVTFAQMCESLADQQLSKLQLQSHWANLRLADSCKRDPTTSGSQQAYSTELAPCLLELPVPMPPRCSLLRCILTKLPSPVIALILSMLPRSSQFPRDGIADILQALLRSQWRSRPSMEGIIARNACVCNATINRPPRAHLVNWLAQVQRKLKWKRDVLFIAVSILDRYLSRRVLRANVQVLGASALLIAAKLEEIEDSYVSQLVQREVHHLGVSVQNILDMEMSILVALDFLVASPTAAHILPYFLMANQGRIYLKHDPVRVTDELLAGMAVLAECETDLDERLAQLAWHLVELALRDFDMVCYAPSEVAAAAIVISNQTFNQIPAWPQMMVQLSGHTEISLEGCLAKLELLYLAALAKANLPNTQVHAVRETQNADAIQPRCDDSEAASQQPSSSAPQVDQENPGRQIGLRPDLAGVLWPHDEASKVSRQRLRHEFQELEAHPLEGSFAGPVDGDLLCWRATVMGPEGSPYQDGLFTLTIRFPLDYPFNAPRVCFDTRIYHCNISPDGAIGLSILEHWSPAMDVAKILSAVSALMSKPNPCEPQPLMQHIAQMYQSDPTKHDRTAREWTRLHATLH